MIHTACKWTKHINELILNLHFVWKQGVLGQELRPTHDTELSYEDEVARQLTSESAEQGIRTFTAAPYDTNIKTQKTHFLSGESTTQPQTTLNDRRSPRAHLTLTTVVYRPYQLGQAPNDCRSL